MPTGQGNDRLGPAGDSAAGCARVSDAPNNRASHMTDTSEQFTALEIQLGQALVDSVSPDEAPYFDDIVAAASSPSKKRRDNALGFGVPVGDIGAISAAILVLCKPILSFIWEYACEAAGQMMKDLTEQTRLTLEKRISDWIRKKFQKPSPIEVPPEKLEAFLESIKEQSLLLGLDNDKSVRLINMLRGCLA
jgi:hypothetical protein